MPSVFQPFLWTHLGRRKEESLHPFCSTPLFALATCSTFSLGKERWNHISTSLGGWSSPDLGARAQCALSISNSASSLMPNPSDIMLWTHLIRPPASATSFKPIRLTLLHQCSKGPRHCSPTFPNIYCHIFYRSISTHYKQDWTHTTDPFKQMIHIRMLVHLFWRSEVTFWLWTVSCGHAARCTVAPSTSWKAVIDIFWEINKEFFNRRGSYRRRGLGKYLLINKGSSSACVHPKFTVLTTEVNAG